MAAIEPVQIAASILSADFCSLGEQVEEAIARLHRLLDNNHLDHVKIAVDGGIHLSIAAAVVTAGAHMLVAGSEVFNSRVPVRENVQALLATLHSVHST